MKFHINGSSPKIGQIFVFGSNLGGLHHGGAARAAYTQYGARMFIGVGPTGNCYAIPSVNELMNDSLSIIIITEYVKQFREYVKLRQDQVFFITAIGCGIAGYRHSDIAPLFKGFPDNCDFPEEWKDFI